MINVPTINAITKRWGANEPLRIGCAAGTRRYYVVAQFLPTKYFRYAPCIPEWMTAPPLPWRMHCNTMGYDFSGFIAVTPVA